MYMGCMTHFTVALELNAKQMKCVNTFILSLNIKICKIGIISHCHALD